MVEVNPHNSPMRNLSFKSIHLGRGEIYEDAYSDAPVDLAVIVLSGSVELDIDGIWNIRRNSMLDSLPAGLIHRTRSALRATGTGEGCELAIASTYSKTSHVLDKPHLLSPSMTTTQIRGNDYSRRLVRTIHLPIEDFGLLIGETVAEPGNWSSYPPHKHDKSIPGQESRHEECYLHHFEPKKSWGFQGIFSPERNVEEAYFIRDGDVFVIPFGYHPVVPEPGARHHYLWVLSGTDPSLMMNTHEQYKDHRA